MSESSPPEADGLVTPDVKSWSADKHWYLQRYINIFTGGMKKKWADQLHYVDLFAGAGVEAVDGIGLQWGSPLIAAQSTPPFHQLHLVELDSTKYAALTQRLARFHLPTEPQCLSGDANAVVDDVVNAIPTSGTLTLAFLDPYGLHLDFETMHKLTSGGRRIDFIVLFPDRYDALRNFGIYMDNPDSNLDRTLGTGDWRAILKEYPREQWAERLRVLYEKQIGSLGYDHFDCRRISRPDRSPMYQLIFCSRHERGGEFWAKIAQRERGGQQRLF